MSKHMTLLNWAIKLLKASPFAPLAALVGLSCFSSIALAQNLTVIGGNSLARECYQVSVSASMTGFTSRDELETCSNAINHGHLSHRDLIATYVNRGVINVALEHYQEAAKDYNRAIRMDSEVAEAYLNRGNLWFLANRYLEAIKDYDRSIKLGIAQPHVALLNRGMVYELKGDFQLAKSDYLAALEKVAEWPLALQKLERVSKKIK